MKKIGINIIVISLAFTLLNGITSCNRQDTNSETDDCMEFISLPNDYNEIVYLEFLDANTGWAIGKKGLLSHDLLNTTDGGVTWSVVNTDFQMEYDNGFTKGEALQFVSATNGIKKTKWVSLDELTIQYTTDKGITWNDYNNTFVDINGNPDQEYVIPSYFASNGAETILISGGTASFSGWTYKTMIIINNSTMQVTQSVNEHYDPSSLQYPVTINRVLKYAQNGTVTALVTKNSDNTGNLFVAQSTNKGETWTYTSDVNSTYFNSSSWVNDNIGYIAVGNTTGAEKIYKTTDAGATWTIINNIPPEFQMIRFVDANNGIGVTDFDFFYTTDGGVSWIEKCKDNYFISYDEVLAYPSLNNAWIAGSLIHENYIDSDKGLFHFIGE